MKIVEISPDEPDAISLMEELSKSLENITGDSGKNSFDSKDVCVPRSLFVIAYNDEGEATGCGCFRPMNEHVAEVKRMYSKKKGMGVGTEILVYLETQAKKLQYSALWLETRRINDRAVSFYNSLGYHPIPNYGKYSNNPKAICFEKKL